MNHARSWVGIIAGSGVRKLAEMMQQSSGYGVRWLSDVPYVGKHQLIVRYSRASGAGGQHVNKTESKVDMRVRLDDIEMPTEVRKRLMEQQRGRINKNGEFVVVSMEHRERQKNYNDCMSKMAEAIKTAQVEPERRNMNSKTKGEFHMHRLADKRRQQAKKQARRGADD